MANQVMLIAPSSSSGKTIVCVALCRALSDAGTSAAPFKAIAVIKERDLRGHKQSDLPRWGFGIVHHLRAGRLRFETEMNPVAVWPTGENEGDLYIDGQRSGRARFINEDHVALGDLSPDVRQRVNDAVVRAYRSLADRYDQLLIEGAASPVDQPPEADIANILVSRLSGSPLVHATRLSKGGGAASIIGTHLCLPEDVQKLVVGYVWNDVTDEGLATYGDEIVRKHTGLSPLARIPHLALWDGPPETYPSDEEAYGHWARSVFRAFRKDAPGLSWLGALP